MRYKGANVLRFAPLPAILCLACATPLPGTAPPRESGQSALMGQTNAGKIRCDSSEHLRPFVIEWDATDLSSFEARAATDLIFVRYDQCHLEVLDSCTDDSVRGSLGAYGAVTWTAGVLEKVEIQSEAELGAKLPLGVATLGARVGAGEKFQMEYLVAGTKKATRAAIYRGDLEHLAGCRGATHFVYAYNLGAFVLGSLTRASAEAGATLWGLGAGASNQSERAVEKRGGVLQSCRGDSAQEIETCKAPIRLTLRAIEDGENPDKTAAKAPETPDALNLAGKLQAQGERSSEASERMQIANQKLNAGDGAGCLKELDAADKLAAKGTQLSTEPQSYLAMTRARCLMETGQCDAGKSLLRRSQAAMNASLSPQQLDTTVDAFVGMNCKGDKLEPRDRILRSLAVLQDGAYQKTISDKDCQSAVDAALKVWPSVKPRGPEDAQITSAPRRLMDTAQRCLSKAGNCAGAFRALKAWVPHVHAAEKHEIYAGRGLIEEFVNTTRGACLQKPLPGLSPQEVLWRMTKELDLNEREIEWSPARCKVSVELGRTAMKSLGDPSAKGELRSAIGSFHSAAVGCFDRTGDCASAYAIHLELFGLTNPGTKPANFARSFDTFLARNCSKGPIPGLKGDEEVYWAAQLLDRERSKEEPDVARCQALMTELSATVRPEHKDAGMNDLMRMVLGDGAACFARAGRCEEGWKLEKQRLERQNTGGDLEKQRANWARPFKKCER
ncbi:MAG: hypothetical protein U1E65_05030 [Myxococcota bacterium]